MTSVLIVDRDEAIRGAFRQFFAGTGVEVVCAGSFDEVSAKARGQVDLIFSDDLDESLTPERSAELRARNFSTLAPIVCMGRARMSAEALRSLGYAGLLAKPFRGAQVKEMLARWLPMAA